MLALRRYDWIFHLATIALCTFFIAQAVSTYIAGVLEPSANLSLSTASATAGSSSSSATKDLGNLDDYKIITERNIFNSAETAVENEQAQESDVIDPNGLGPAIKTNLDIKVLGTLVIGDGMDRRSSAVITSKGSKGSDTYYVEQAQEERHELLEGLVKEKDSEEKKSFAPNTRLTKVEQNRIEFLNGGRLEYAELEDFTDSKSVFASADQVHGLGASSKGDKEKSGDKEKVESSSSIVVDQNELDQALQNLDKLMTDVRIVPNFKDGRPAGMKVLSVKPGSMISKLGIKRGDIMEKVNGQELDMKQGMDLFSQMKNMKNFTLDVVRGGRNQTLEYEIK